MFPAITSTETAFLIVRTISITPTEWPCAVSTTSTSAPAAASACARSSASGPTPTAAPTRRRPRSSFVAYGNWTFFWMSLTVMSPRSRPSASTTGSFSTLWRWRMSSASASVVPTGAVTRLRAVMSADTDCSTSSSKRRSRFVRIPTRIPSASVMGTPDTLYRDISSSASRTSASGGSVTGSTIMPASERFTLSTSAT